MPISTEKRYHTHVKDLMKVSTIRPITLRSNPGIQMQEVELLATLLDALLECRPIGEGSDVHGMCLHATFGGRGESGLGFFELGSVVIDKD